MSLSPANEYTIRVSIRDYTSDHIALSESRIYVKLEDLKVVITGGRHQTVCTDTTLSLNTSVTGQPSYSSRSTSLLYRWHCLCLSSVSVDCGIADSISLDSPALVLPANTLATSQMYMISVTVMQVATGRSSWSSSIIETTSDPVPLVSIPSILKNIDPNSIMTTLITISTTTEVSVALDLSGVGTDSLSYPSDSFSGIRTIPVQLTESTLSGGGSFTLELLVKPLECLYSIKSCTRSAYTFQTEISTNHPPLGGTFDVWPASNQLTYFLQASGWIDADLPLNYAFFRCGGLTHENQTTTELSVLKQFSDLNIMNTVLASDSRTDSSEIQLVLMVSDGYGRITRSNRTIVVTTEISQDYVYLETNIAHIMTYNDTDKLLQW
eukprot:CAMPEP_0182440456 /NCGR_PEP_ID=MMETSP1167-20130531/87080_1 /TAXON_ID=2988 /ORGANISM="Mallomonas Sp, Strain CCMP3275" /LENGTH=380 /DNA_ID=CAMNT_0024634425 /DNA_START=947 /DNA_END=2086 /DNA_ORIENTATION=-